MTKAITCNLRAAFLGLILVITLAYYCDACIHKFKSADKMENFTKACLVKAGFKKGNLPTTEMMMKPDFDDKCASKCIFGAFDLIDDEGHLDRDLIMDFLEENSPPPLLIKLTELVTSCADSSGMDKVKGTKQGKTPTECKPFSKFYSCFVTAADKLC